MEWLSRFCQYTKSLLPIMPLKLRDLVLPRTLQQRNMYYVILPTMLILLVVGLVCLRLARDVLLKQWEQTAIAYMQQSAHRVDMLLMRPKELLEMYQQNLEQNYSRKVAHFLLDEIRQQEGVITAQVIWLDGEHRTGVNDSMMEGMRIRRQQPLELTTPEYDTELQGPTISLVSEFHDQQGKPVGRIVVKILFYSLVRDMVGSAFWQENMAFIVDSSGNVLTKRNILEFDERYRVEEKFGQRGDLEKVTMQEINSRNHGIVYGAGVPPEQVSAFYRLGEAPWALVLVAPGERILQDIITFRHYFFWVAGLGMITVLIFIKLATSGPARSIRKVSESAQNLANGQFGPELEEKGRDEVAQLVRNFNVMTRQLQERMVLQEAMNVAREVQQNLLPKSSYLEEGIDIFGLSEYHDETGGDYYDILPDQHNCQKVAIVVGDVVGHGIGAALLMASVRALVRCRSEQPGTLVEVVSDVNELLYRDTEKTGNFVTLFFLGLERDRNRIRWVRCGHEPAVLYDPAAEQFLEMRGEGLVLGFDKDWQYKENSIEIGNRELLVMIGSDGVWEAQSPQGDYFGRERVEQLIAANYHLSSEELSRLITAAVIEFCGDGAQGDDITLVIVKINGKTPARQ